MWAAIGTLEAEASLRLYTALVAAGDRSLTDAGRADVLGVWQERASAPLPRTVPVRDQFHRFFDFLAKRLGAHPGRSADEVQVQTATLPRGSRR
jgi:hypothetical protein